MSCDQTTMDRISVLDNRRKNMISDFEAVELSPREREFIFLLERYRLEALILADKLNKEVAQ